MHVEIARNAAACGSTTNAVYAKRRAVVDACWHFNSDFAVSTMRPSARHFGQAYSITVPNPWQDGHGEVVTTCPKIDWRTRRTVRRRHSHDSAQGLFRVPLRILRIRRRSPPRALRRACRRRRWILRRRVRSRLRCRHASLSPLLLARKAAAEGTSTVEERFEDVAETATEDVVR